MNDERVTFAFGFGSAPLEAPSVAPAPLAAAVPFAELSAAHVEAVARNYSVVQDLVRETVTLPGCSWSGFTRLHWRGDAVDAAPPSAASDGSACVVDIARRVDLQRGVYEGGFKVWESTWDLVNEAARESSELSTQLRGARVVLDLGCGHGLAGAAALLCGAKSVWFQDLNREVLERVTAPTLMANELDLARCRFLAGDWTELLTSLDGAHAAVDVLVSAETVYYTRNFDTLCDCVRRWLRPVTGRAYFAGKRYYHGNGGGTTAFVEHVEQHAPDLHIESVSSPAGASRELVCLCRRDPVPAAS